MQSDLFGTNPHKIIRTNAPDTSVKAGHSVDTAGDEKIVFDLVCRSGERGLTIKECARLMDKFPHQISGRFTGLQEKKLIEDGGERRERSRCMVKA